MALVTLDGRLARSDAVFLATPGDFAPPTPTLIGAVRLEDGAYVQRVGLPEPGEGYAWRILAPGGVLNKPSPGESDVLLAFENLRLPAVAYLVDAAGRPGLPLQLALAWPEDSADAPPVVVGAVDDVAAEIGDAVTVDAGAAFSGDNLHFTARLVSGPLPAGWTIDAVTGLVTIPTAGLFAGSVIVEARNGGGVRSIQFGVEITAPGIVNTAAPSFAWSSTVPGGVGTVTPGTWEGGVGALTVERQFLRNGVAITLWSSALTYTIGVPDYGSTITAVERALDEFGQAVSVPAPQALVVPLVTEAPTVVGTVADVTVVAGAGTVERLTAPAFHSNSAMTFTATVDGAAIATLPGWSINASSGRVEIPIAEAFAERIVRVTATNVIGDLSAFLEFHVTVIPLMVVVTPPTFTPAAPPGLTVGSIWNFGAGSYAGGRAPFPGGGRRILRSGAAITNYATGVSSYTIQEADRGHTITAQIQRVDSSPTPQVLEVMATGQAIIPAAVVPPDTATADVVVSNAAGLTSALNAAPNNASRRYIIGCNGGAYGNFTYPANYNKGSTLVQVRSQNRASPAVFTALTITGGRNFELEGLCFWKTSLDPFGFPAGGNCLELTNCRGIAPLRCRVRNCSTRGGMFGMNATNIHRTDFDYNEFLGAAVDAVRFKASTLSEKCADNRFRGNRLSSLHPTMTFPNLQSQIGYANMLNDATDPRRSDQVGGDTQVLNLAGQLVTVTQAEKLNRHPDLFQTWGPIEDLIFEDNELETGNAYRHCILCRDGPGGNAHYNTGLIFRRNSLTGAHVHGIFIRQAINPVVRDTRFRRRANANWGLHYRDTKTDDIHNVGLSSRELDFQGTHPASRILATNNVFVANPSSYWQLPGKITSNGNVNSATANPTGWADFAVAKGQVGPYGYEIAA